MIVTRVSGHAAGYALAIGLGVVCADAANAASPAYCALYAREYATARVASATTDNHLSAKQRLEDQAFTKCLNLDVEPEFPSTSVYYGQATEDIVGFELAQGDASPPDETLVAETFEPPIEEIAPEPAPPPKAKPKAKKKKPQVVASIAPPPEPEPSGGIISNLLRPGTAAVASNVTRTSGGSGDMKPWTDEWRSWCFEHFPNSFDPETGTVLPLKGKKRVLCQR